MCFCIRDIGIKLNKNLQFTIEIYDLGFGIWEYDLGLLLMR